MRVAQERAVADLQLHFKVQVQEWKNVLLRGKDEAAPQQVLGGLRQGRAGRQGRRAPAAADAAGW
jgi:hypothetical protein